MKRTDPRRARLVCAIIHRGTLDPCARCGSADWRQELTVEVPHARKDATESTATLDLCRACLRVLADAVDQALVRDIEYERALFRAAPSTDERRRQRYAAAGISHLMPPDPDPAEVAGSGDVSRPGGAA